MRRLYWIAGLTLLVLLMAVLVYHLDRAQDALAPRTNEEVWLDVGEQDEFVPTCPHCGEVARDLQEESR